MGSLKLTTASSGSVILSPANTASDVTITVPAVTGTMATIGPAFSAYSATNQSISAGVPTKVVCGTEEFDTNNNFDTSTSRFTPTVAGYYQCTGMVESNAVGTDAYFIAMLYKNGSKIASGTNYPTILTAGPNALVTSLIYCNGSTDYVEFYGQRQSASTFVSGVGTKFQAVMVRAA